MVFGSRVRVDNGSDRDMGVGTVTISSAIFVRDLDIRRRYGESSVSIVGVVITGRTSINAGRDATVIALDDSTFIRQVTIRTGAGDDVIDVEANGDREGEKSTFSDRLTVTTGDGDDTITIGVADESGNSAILSRGGRIDGGRGDDVLDVLSNGNYRLLSETLSDRNIETIL